MIVYFADRYFNIIGQASTNLICGLTIVDDRKVEDIDSGVSTFEFTIPFNDSNRKDAESFCAVGNYLLRSHNGEQDFFTVIDCEVDTKRQEVTVYAEDAGLDLLNEIVGAYEPAEAHDIAHYVNKFAYDSGFVIGVNEVTGVTKKLSWDDDATATERIADVAKQFDAEISYSFEIKGLSVTKKLINIYKERGNDVGVQLRLNKELDRIITKTSIANLATALLPEGGTPEDAENPINLSGYTYDDGDIYLEGRYLKSRSAIQKWSRYLNPSEPQTTYTGHILKKYSCEALTQADLCTEAVAHLKKISNVEVNYNVEFEELPDDVRIGDRVNIVDDSGAIYISARILELETSVANKSQSATIGEYLIKSGGIAQKVADLAAKYAKEAQATAKAYIAAQNDATAAANAAATAQSKADTAEANASTAQTAADNAKTAADAAQKAADDAQADVDALAIRVTSAETSITQNSEQIALRATKQEVTETLGGYYTKTEADAAIQIKANEINSTVEEKFDGLGTRVSTVEQTASGLSVSLEDAEYGIATAQSMADNAQSTANNTKTSANNAAKTATNFLSYDATNGLQVGNKSGGNWSGYSARIKPKAFEIVDENGTTISSYGANLVELGKNNYDTMIQMCSGLLTILYNNSLGQAELTADKIGLIANQRVGMETLITREEAGGVPIDYQSVVSCDGTDLTLSMSRWDTDLKTGEYSKIKIKIDDLVNNIGLESGTISIVSDDGVGITGKTTVTGDFSASGELESGNATVKGTLSTTGNATVGGALTTTGNATIGGNLSANYVTGTWLQGTAANAAPTKQDRVCVMDSSGWVYTRTLAQILGDIGISCGTWTATINGGSITKQICTYMKVGNMCSISFYITGTGGTGTGTTNFYIGGAPYSPNSSATWYGGGCHVQGLYDTANYPVTGCVIHPNKRIYIRTAQIGGTGTGYVRVNNGGATFHLSGSITYPVA